MQADKRSLSRPVFDGDDGVVDRMEGSEGRLNLSGDSAASSTSGVSSNFELPADIVSCSIGMCFLLQCLYNPSCR